MTADLDTELAAVEERLAAATKREADALARIQKMLEDFEREKAELLAEIERAQNAGRKE